MGLESTFEIVDDRINIDIKERRVPGSDSGIPVDQDLQPDQCLLCCNNVVMDVDSDINGNARSQMSLNQLNDLLKVFRISLDSFEGIRPEGWIPSKLFCEPCSKNICEALDLLSGIESLQKNFKILTKILQETLLNNWASKVVNASEFNNHIRKILVQCFSGCKVLVERPSLKVSSGKRNNFWRKIQPSTNSRQLTDVRKSIRRSTSKYARKIIKEELKDFSEPNMTEFESDGDVDYVPFESDGEGEQVRVENNSTGESSVYPKKGKTSVVRKMKNKLQLASVLHGRVGKKKPAKERSNRVYDDHGRAISFECSFCQKKLIRQDYVVESGEYVFKCSPDCCEKTISSFGNLISHHEASCPVRPRRHQMNKNTSADAIRKVSGQQIGLKHNDRHLVVGFECPFCQKQMLPSDFKLESGQYLFKCTWDSCDTVTRTFFNMAYHHHSHCSGKRRRRWKSAHKSRAEDQITKDTSSSGEPMVSSSKSGNGREYDLKGRIISFECPQCEKKMTRTDFVDEATNSFAFKCSPICCEKNFSTFANLIFHHESRCKSTDGEQTTDNQHQVRSVKRKKPKEQMRPYFPLETFQCKHCRKCYKKQEYTKEDSGGIIFDCDILDCDKSFRTFSVFRRHHEATCPEKPPGSNICEHCGKKCQNGQILRNHLASFHTGDFKYFCDKCGVGLVSTQALRRHMLTHISERNFQCTYCSSTFKRKDHLINHERRHRAELTHMCGVCGKRFAVREGLRQHELNFHGQGEFVCPTCKKTFKSISYLRHHVWATHKGMRRSMSKRGIKHKEEECEIEIVEAMEILPVEAIKTCTKSRQLDILEGSRIHEEDIMAVNSLLSMTTVDIEIP
ncbi:unnamed protein product [Allacma fusca]|uniref:C2H2-type domain-containing protein n=1 Tax=Allacma fusca TaxID=39272 RepID=A0A8J2L1Z8_9HEXA|nr:unnamed protein product [Allacma fusca]